MARWSSAHERPGRRSDARQYRWRDLSLRGKGLVVIAIPLFALLLTSTVFYAGARSANDADRWVAHTFEVQSELDQVDTKLVEAELDARGYLLSRRDDLRSAYLAAATGVEAAFDRLSSLMADHPAQERRLAELRAAFANRPLDASLTYGDRAADGPPPVERLSASRANLDRAMLRHRGGLMNGQPDEGWRALR